MKSAKPDGTAADIAAARQARRELHEEIQAARETLRDLRAELAGYGALIAAAGARTQAALDDCERRVQAEIDGLTAHITAENAKVLDAIARYLGAGSPEDLLRQVVNALCEAVTPILSGQLMADMPQAVRECIEDMKAEGARRHKESRRAVEYGFRIEAVTVPGADNGASGAVPGWPGH